jgi:alpha-L-rhamnosidase
MISVYDLSVNYLKNPCGVDNLPRFSYKVSSDIRADGQKARRICVYKEDTLVWDSGIIEDANTVLIPYGGDALAPVTRYRYIVESESIHGEKASEEGTFVTGKLSEKWSAKWISHWKANKTTECALYLRKVFRVKKEIKDAYLTICGLGYFESFINGEKTGDDILSPAFTRYDEESYYMQYDVTDKLTVGENAIGVSLGNGWYNCFTADRMWNTTAATWRNWPKLLCEIKINYTDGSTETVISDTSWKASFGPITFTGIRNGEFYDARLELGDWCKADYDESAWERVRINKSPGGLLVAQEMEPIRVYEKFPAVKKWKTKNGWAFDVGQNLAGYGEYTLYGKADTEITFRYSDMLTEDNELDFFSLTSFIRSGEFQTDKYIKKSDGAETWHPSFVYHGFQYIEVTGIDYEPELSDIVGVAICSDVGDIGSFSCSDDFLNKLQHLCRWSTLANIHSIPTDDPHREKNGWTGDTMLSSEQMLTNFGMRAFLTKWSRDMRTSQRPAGQIPCVVPSTGWGYYGLMGPDWSAALLMIPWNIYLYNGDIDILKINYEAIKKNCDFMESMTDDYTLRYGTGDWCAPFEGPAIGVNMGSYKCPVQVTDTGFFYNAANTLAKLAKMFGKADDEAYYTDLAATIRGVFREKFFDKETFTVKGDCQTATATMLYFGLYDNEEEKEGLLKKLLSQIDEKDGHLDFGVLGNKFVMHTLGATGYGSVGEKMVAQRTFPGVGEWIARGATTLWECWNGGGSHNHHMFSDLSSFMYKFIGGISPDENEPGFSHIIFRPAVDGDLASAHADHESMRGKVAIDWAKEDEKTTITLTVPFGTHGTLYLPESYAGKLSENGAVLPFVLENGKSVFQFASGVYTLEA